jgi:hypothetical protein
VWVRGGGVALCVVYAWTRGVCLCTSVKHTSVACTPQSYLLEDGEEEGVPVLRDQGRLVDLHLAVCVVCGWILCCVLCTCMRE